MIERLYQINHPRIVTRFDQILEVPVNNKGYWISKMWLKGMFCTVSGFRADRLILLVEIGDCWNPRCISYLKATQPPTILLFIMTSAVNIKTSHLILLLAGEYLRRSVTCCQHETRLNLRKSRPRAYCRLCIHLGNHCLLMQSFAQYAMPLSTSQKKINENCANGQKMKRWEALPFVWSR